MTAVTASPDTARLASLGMILVGCRNPALHGEPISTPHGGHKIVIPADGVCEVPDDCGLLAAGPDFYLIAGSPRALKIEKGKIVEAPGEWRWFSCDPELAGETIGTPAGSKIRFGRDCRGFAPANCGLDKCGYAAGALLTDEELALHDLRRPEEPEPLPEPVERVYTGGPLELLKQQAALNGIILETPEDYVRYTEQLTGAAANNATASAAMPGQINPNLSGLPPHMLRDAPAHLQAEIAAETGRTPSTPSLAVDPNSTGLPPHLAATAGPVVKNEILKARAEATESQAAPTSRATRAQAAREAAAV